MSQLTIIFITGVSGSGKSVALRALEDVGFNCVDNLPPALIEAFIHLQEQQQPTPAPIQPIAIAVDIRSAHALPVLPSLLAKLQARSISYQLIFLEASDETLLHRYSETRRLHPLSNPLSNPLSHPTPSDHRLALIEAIALERQLLSQLRLLAHVIDTSFIQPPKLQSIIKDLVLAPTEQGALTVVFESFAFKRGVPLDADYVFDVRMLPNPHYEANLKALTGKDAAVIDYLAQRAPVQEMLTQIHAFLDHWLPALQRDHRAYVTVAIGCTGGQHRSVYLAEQLHRLFQAHWRTLVRHRELLP